MLQFLAYAYKQSGYQHPPRRNAMFSDMCVCRSFCLSVHREDLHETTVDLFKLVHLGKWAINLRLEFEYE